MIVPIVVIIILLLFGVGLLALLSVRGEFVEEHENLTALEVELKNHTDATALYQSVRASVRMRQDSIVCERVEVIFKLSKKNISPSLSELSELTIATKDATTKTQFSNFVLSTLLIVGLGGTFLAFREILANSDLSGSMSNGSVDLVKYQAAVARIYDGFNAAFWASICGIFGTVALLFVRFMVVNPRKERFFNRLDFVTQSELIPLFSSLYARPEGLLLKAATKLDALITTLQPVSQNLNSSASKVTGAVGDLNKFASVLNAATTTFSDFTNPDSPLIKAVGQLFDAIQKSESRYHKYEAALLTLIDEVKNQNARLAETQLKFTELNTTIENLHQQFRRDLEQLNRTYQAEIAQITQTFRSEVKAIIQNTGDVLEKLKKVADDLHSRQETYAKEFKAATEKLDSAMNKIEATIKALDSSVNKIDAPAQKLLNSVSEVRNMLNNVDSSVKQIGISRADVQSIQDALRTINRTFERKKFTLSLFGWRL